MTYPRGGTFELPTATAGEVVIVHVPDIGMWVVKEVVRHPKWGYFYRLTRGRGAAVQHATVDVSGVEIIRPDAAPYPYSHPNVLHDEEVG